MFYISNILVVTSFPIKISGRMSEIIFCSIQMSKNPFDVLEMYFDKIILDCHKNSISKILWTHIIGADSREVLLLQHLARIPYPVRPSSLGTAKADALWNTVGNISISSPIQNVEQKIYISFVKRFLVTQWKSCDLWLLCLEALIIELSF